MAREKIKLLDAFVFAGINAYVLYWNRATSFLAPQIRRMRRIRCCSVAKRRPFALVRSMSRKIPSRATRSNVSVDAGQRLNVSQLKVKKDAIGARLE